jgi:hypothetical protein
MRRHWRAFKAASVSVFDEIAWPLAGSLFAIVLWRILYWAT